MVNLSAAGRKALDDLVTQTEKEGKISGFTVGVSNRDEEIYLSTGGHRIYGDPTSGPVTRDSVYWICSMTKLITSLATLHLVDQGKLSLDDPVSKFLPEFKNAIVLEGAFITPNPTYKPVKEVMTVLHLLTHTSGLSYVSQLPNPDFHELPPGMTFKQGPTLEATKEAFFEIIKDGYPGIRLTCEPGRGFTYGYNCEVLGLIVREVTGISLAEYCEKNIFKPLGINTSLRLTKELNEKLVELTFRNPDKSLSRWADQIVIPPRYPEEVFFDLAGIEGYSTLADYMTLLRHIIQIEAGQEVSNPILKHETAKSLFQPQITNPEIADRILQTISAVDYQARYQGFNWSTGLAINPVDWPGYRKAHTGTWPGWAGTGFLADPTTGLVIVTGTQVVPGPDSEASVLFEKVERIVYANLEED